MSRALLCFLLLPAACLTFASELSGVVTDVQDGDSLTLVNLRETYRVRLVDIDAPEFNQEGGKESRTSLREVCLFKKAVAETFGEDRYGRTLARVRCAGVDANAEQVRRGWAWVFVRYVRQDSPLFGVEREARAARRGLWATEAPVPPWKWRELKRVKEQ